MDITSDFECGNIIVEQVTDTEASLSIRKDTNARYYQWFYFKVTGDVGIKRTFTVVNADGASYTSAWNGYDVLQSYDGQSWQRLPTQYDGQHLIFTHQADQEESSYAFFVPYFEHQREQLIKECDASSLATTKTIGQSLDGKPIQMITIGDTEADHKKVWIVTRQHAGEPMAEYATDGLVRYLLDENNATAQSLLESTVFYIVPNMNPDGSFAGNLRANAAGVDLNRAWDKPSDQCPEIVAVRDAIATTGVDYFFDVHGDEERPFIWLIGPRVEILPEIAATQTQYEDILATLSPQIQSPPDVFTSATPPDLGMSVDYIAATYNSPGWIIELPFKAVPDGQGDADSLLAEGCMQFGRNCIEALHTLFEK